MQSPTTKRMSILGRVSKHMTVTNNHSILPITRRRKDRGTHPPTGERVVMIHSNGADIVSAGSENRALHRIRSDTTTDRIRRHVTTRIVRMHDLAGTVVTIRKPQNAFEKIKRQEVLEADKVGGIG
jgi:hypothetical protein